MGTPVKPKNALLGILKKYSMNGGFTVQYHETGFTALAY